MRSDVVFDSPYLDRCLRFGWYLDIIMLLLLRDISLMFGADLVMDLDDWDCTFDDGWSDVVWFFLSTKHLMPYCGIFPLRHPYASHYQFDFLHYLIIVTIFTLGILKSMAREIFYTYCDHWYLGLVFLCFYYLITLAYITSHVLRPPWGHGIRCRIRQPLLG